MQAVKKLSMMRHFEFDVVVEWYHGFFFYLMVFVWMTFIFFINLKDMLKQKKIEQPLNETFIPRKTVPLGTFQDIPFFFFC